MKGIEGTCNQALRALTAVVVCAALVGWESPAAAAVTNGWNQTTAGTYIYTDSGNWFGGTVNDTFDPSLTLTGGDQTLTFGADYTTAGLMRFAHDDVNVTNVNLRSDGSGEHALTLAGDVTYTPIKATTRLLRVGWTNPVERLSVDLGAADRVFEIGTAGGTGADPGGGITLYSAVGNGTITKTGVGWLRVGGSSSNDQANALSGLTVSSGVVRLQKLDGVDAVAGDILINGGALLIGSHNQIANTASITLASGGLYFAATTSTTSGNLPKSETIKNLTITGGTFSGSPKTAGSSAGAPQAVLDTMSVSGGTILVKNGSTFTVGRLRVSGSSVSVYASSGSSQKTTTLVVGAGGLEITNVASGAFVPITVGANGRVTLSGDVSFSGFAGNTNTATINATVADRTFDLSAATRTFTINDGDADVDLSIAPNFSLINGGVQKSGPGTLRLQCSGTYTGVTDVVAGRLLVDGAVTNSRVVVVRDGATLGGSGSLATAAASTTTVESGATLAPGSSTGVLTTGSLAFESGATLAVELNGASAGSGYDRLSVTGTISVAGADLSASLGYAPTDGDTLFIVTNDDVEATGGTFNGLPDGKIIALDYDGKTYGFQIGYSGDVDTEQTTGGNDVVLLAVPYSPATTILVR